ncbi:MAG: MFS transporter [Bacteroidetes bacterium]|nr:MFS transporter [Bacteroidota bacterium]
MTQPPISNKVRRIALSGFFFFTGICFASWASRIPDIKMQLGLNDAELGALLLFLPFGTFLGIPISGSITSIYGSNRILKIAAVVYPLSLVLIGTISNTWQLACCLFLFGMAGNLYNVSVNTQAAVLSKLYDKSIISTFHGFWSLAGFVGGLVGGLFVAKQILPLHQFIVVAFISICYLLIAHSYLMPSEKNKQPLLKLWNKPSPLILQFGFIALGNMICEGMMFDWSGIFFQKVVIVSDEFRTLGYISFMACMTIGRMFSDILINYWGTRKQLMFSGLLVTIGLVVAVALPDILLSTIGFMLVGFGVSSVIPTIYGTVGRAAAPGQTSIALASVSSIGFFGFLIGPPIIGFLSHAIGLRWAFLSISLLGMATFFQSYRLRKHLN